MSFKWSFGHVFLRLLGWPFGFLWLFIVASQIVLCFLDPFIATKICKICVISSLLPAPAVLLSCYSLSFSLHSSLEEPSTQKFSATSCASRPLPSFLYVTPYIYIYIYTSFYCFILVLFLVSFSGGSRSKKVPVLEVLSFDRSFCQQSSSVKESCFCSRWTASPRQTPLESRQRHHRRLQRRSPRRGRSEPLARSSEGEDGNALEKTQLERWNETTANVDQVGRRRRASDTSRAILTCSHVRHCPG